MLAREILNAKGSLAQRFKGNPDPNPEHPTPNTLTLTLTEGMAIGDGCVGSEARCGPSARF